ncbi:MAG: hypothetical protein MUP98_06890, partial [Candidatus Aminicenantes bacterium]|nr:hypothetical protein [Candidatus Aminicenantes bacterium]
MIKEVHLKKDLNLVLTSRPFHGSAAVFPSAHKDAQPVTAEISSRSSMSPFLIHPCKALSVILWLVALHSFIVGLGLIL